MGNYKDLNDYEIMYMVEENDQNANDLIYEKYKPLVVSMATKYYNQAKRYGLELDDLIQEGYLGICSAINHYRSDMSVKFYTYVVISIKSKILNCLKLHNTCKSKVLNNSVSLDEPLYLDDKLLIDTIEDENSLFPDIELEYNEMYRLIKKFMYSLKFNDSLIFELRLNGFSNREIASLLDISLSTITKLWSSMKKEFFKSLNLT